MEKGRIMIHFTVREWMNDLVVFVEPDDTVARALEVMRRRYIHSLIVRRTNDSPEYGIITSTDICDKIIAQEKNPNDIKVRDVMNSPLIAVESTITLKECAQIMKENKIHHLPVIDGSKEVIGMISASDFLVAAEAMGRAPGDRII
jgi:CBS domain-containing protein